MLNRLLNALGTKDALHGAKLLHVTQEDGRELLLCCVAATTCLETPESEKTTVFQRLLGIEFYVHVPTKEELIAWMIAHPALLTTLGVDTVLLAIGRHLASEHLDSGKQPSLWAYDIRKRCWVEYHLGDTRAQGLAVILRRDLPCTYVMIPFADVRPRAPVTTSATSAYRHEIKKL